MIAVARTSMGFCACGLEIAPGEQYRTLGATAVHIGCEGKARSTDTGPNLFTLTAAPDPEPKPTRVFEPTYLETANDAPQLRRTFDLMRSGKPWTLETLARELGCLETSAGARIRDLRKREHGGHAISCKARADGVREYRMIVANGADGAANAA